MYAQVNLPRKERERLARREEILDAARTVFSERGFEKAKLDEIAEVAELGKGTIYNYFKNKEELFVSVIVRGIQRLQSFIEDSIQSRPTPKAKIESYIDAFFKFFEKHRQIFSILVLERNNLARSLNDDMFTQFCELEADFQGYLAKLFEEGIKNKQFKKMNSLKLAQCLFGLIHVTMIHAIRDPESVNLKEDAALIKKILFEGISSE